MARQVDRKVYRQVDGQIVKELQVGRQASGQIGAQGQVHRKVAGRWTGRQEGYRAS
jgi:hypothetical protein